MGIRLGHTPYYLFEKGDNDFTTKLIPYVLLLTIEVGLTVIVAAWAGILDFGRDTDRNSRALMSDEEMTPVSDRKAGFDLDEASR